MADLIGQRLGNYEIVSLLGEGGMAAVYRARQLNIKRDVAIKVIKPGLLDSARMSDFVRRFEREAETIAALDHPHILKLFDYGQHEGMLYLVMPLLTGGSLMHLIRDQGPMQGEQAGRLLEQVASALDHAHLRGVIHRDLKPANVLLDSNGHAILTDFGIAKVVEQSTLTQSGLVMGTPSYMSPEQWRGQQLDARSDVYALGIIAFEMLTGHTPFSADTPSSLMYMHLQEPPPPVRDLRPDLPSPVDAVIGKALAKDRDRRFASAGIMATAFKTALAGQMPEGLDQPAEPEGTRTAPIVVTGPAKQGEAPRQPKWAGSLVVGGLVLLGVLALLALLLSGGNQGGESTTVVLGPTTTAMEITASIQPTISPTFAPTLTEAQSQSSPTPTLETRLLALATLHAELTRTATQWTLTPTETHTYTPDVQATVNAELTMIVQETQWAAETATAFASYTRTPTPTRTPSLTRTPSPTRTPSVTRTPSPTRTPRPTRTPYMSRTPSVTRTRTPTRTPSLTRTWTPTRTPSVTRTPTPTRTPRPTRTPYMSRTPRPTRTPTPEPTTNPVIIAQTRVAEFATQTATNWTMTPTTTSTHTPDMTGTVNAEIAAILKATQSAGETASASTKLTSTATPTPQPAPGRVTANAQWTPVMQSFDGVEMVLVPAGCFMMGSDDGEESETPIHQVCFSAPFLIDRTEVTNAQFTQLGGQAEMASKWPDPNRPREQITWVEARDFCAVRGARLPSEAEWEYATRGPDGLVYPWGNSFITEGAVYGENSGLETALVGSRKGSASWVGALDLSGNVWEWVNDWYGENYYAESPTDNPTGPSSGTYRMQRGGSWIDAPSSLRAAYRDGGEPVNRYDTVGFRCARSEDKASNISAPTTAAPYLELVLASADAVEPLSPSMAQLVVEVTTRRLLSLSAAGQIGDEYETSYDATSEQFTVRIAEGRLSLQEVAVALTVRGYIEFADFSSVPSESLSTYAGTRVATSASAERAGVTNVPEDQTVHPTIITHSDIMRAQAFSDDVSGSWQVQIDLTPDGAARLGDFSASHIGSGLAIVLDGVVLSIPVIQSRVETPVILSGAFTEAEAQSLEAQISSQPLPIELLVESMGLSTAP